MELIVNLPFILQIIQKLRLSATLFSEDFQFFLDEQFTKPIQQESYLLAIGGFGE
jgi:hypothetical protein